jgi:hypothetical protein
MEPQAAALPDGSIVATATRCWIKLNPDSPWPWRDPDGGNAGNNFIDYQLTERGATVVRRGTG